MDLDLEELRAEQIWMAKQVYIPTLDQVFDPKAYLFGIDVQYEQEKAYCAVAVYTMEGTPVQNYVLKTEPGMAYQSGFFCFREGPAILRILRRILQRKNLLPSLLMIDGHGIAHPRSLGVASWVGLRTNIPSIGIAKRPLLHYEGDLADARGAKLPIWHNSKVVGHALRTQDNIKPIYVSPGYRVSIEQATAIALTLSPTYRLAEPIRTADHIARAFSRGESVDAIIL